MTLRVEGDTRMWLKFFRDMEFQLWCSGLRIPSCQQLWRKLQVKLRFDPWPRSFHMLWGQPKKGGGGEAVKER